MSNRFLTFVKDTHAFYSNIACKWSINMVEVHEAENMVLIDDPLLKRATCDDEDVVVNILCQSFEHDPHMNWLLEKCRSPEKLKIIMTYLFKKTLDVGEIYLTEDNQAVAMWKCEKREGRTLALLLKNIGFLRDIGAASVARILKNERFTYRQYPKQGKFCHLYLIGVLPESQGKGYASKLMDPVLKEMEQKSIPVFLETASDNNVRIYSKKGFRKYNTWCDNGLELYYMIKQGAN